MNYDEVYPKPFIPGMTYGLGPKVFLFFQLALWTVFVLFTIAWFRATKNEKI